MQVCIIGSGKMGDIIVGGILKSGFAKSNEIIASDHSIDRRKIMEQNHRVRTTDDNALAVRQSDIILLCIKPQNAVQVASEIAPVITSQQLVLSIMAGVTLDKLEGWFKHIPVIRAMPNTPSQVSAGMTAITPGSSCNETHISRANQLFSGIGKTIVLDEKHVDAVTGLSASGPAFMYIAIEALADGGVKCGLPRDVAISLAAHMTLGAAKMVIETGKHPALLKDEVTTPAGCTTNGILALEEGGLRVTLIKAVSEATKRASELG